MKGKREPGHRGMPQVGTPDTQGDASRVVPQWRVWVATALEREVERDHEGADTRPYFSAVFIPESWQIFPRTSFLFITK